MTKQNKKQEYVERKKQQKEKDLQLKQARQNKRLTWEEISPII